MAGLVPTIPMVGHRATPDRHHRDKPGDDESAAASFCLKHKRAADKHLALE
jgi:hypothetical protein